MHVPVHVFSGTERAAYVPGKTTRLPGTGDQQRCTFGHRASLRRRAGAESTVHTL